MYSDQAMTAFDKRPRSHEERIKRNRVFILGSGFSADAGVPLTALLLQKTMNKFASECPGVFSRVDRYARDSVGRIDESVDYSQISFSSLCTFLEYIELREYGGGERWSAVGSREKLALRFYLSKTLVEHTPGVKELPNLYIEFAKQLHEGDIIISFNWDGLLEVALEKVGKTYTYNFASNAIWLCKLHGSVNWRLGEPNDLGRPVNTLGWQSLEFSAGIMSQEIYWTPELLSFDVWHSYSPLREVNPYLILPGYGKAFDVRSIATLWYKPEFAFATTHDVFIIGLSLAPDDFFIRSFFLSNLPYIDSYSGVVGRKIYIINPGTTTEGNYGFVLSGRKAELFNQEFSLEHVSLMKEKLVSA
jgi:hypothetical protein